MLLRKQLKSYTTLQVMDKDVQLNQYILSGKRLTNNYSRMTENINAQIGVQL